MTDILGIRSQRQAVREFTWEALWPLFDGSRERLNLAHECIDRHAGGGSALRIQFADGRREEHSFDALAAWSSRFAHWLEEAGIGPGDRVAIMLDPSLAFYGALFGTLKRGAVAVPLFTLFGPAGVALRVQDCQPRLLLVEGDAERWQRHVDQVRVVAADAGLMATLDRYPAVYEVSTRADDLAVFQYTSGTTRALPEAVRHTHRSVVTLMVAALYGVGLERGDRYFCPSSPAWGHGLWHGTIAPLALGIAAGAYSGRFDAVRLLEGLEAFGITNLAAAPTVYRMIRHSGCAGRYRFHPRKLSYTGEPMDSRTFAWVEDTWGVRPCGMYGSTEVGVIIANYPGFADHEVRPGALGKAAPGWEVAIVDQAGAPLPPGEPGEIAVRRRGRWFPVKDRGSMDADGYFHHAGRSDDVIISAGWTMSAVEIEDTLLKHPDVGEAAVIGVPDAMRGQVPKAFVVSGRRDPGFGEELQAFVSEQLSRHEYPREIELVEALPRTPAGKIDRHTLRQRAAGPDRPTASGPEPGP
jgi:acetyl-CoA synthetase